MKWVASNRANALVYIHPHFHAASAQYETNDLWFASKNVQLLDIGCNRLLTAKTTCYNPHAKHPVMEQAQLEACRRQFVYISSGYVSFCASNLERILLSSLVPWVFTLWLFSTICSYLSQITRHNFRCQRNQSKNVFCCCFSRWVFLLNVI